jgi:hypothetical protein
MGKLLRSLLAYLRGEPKVWSVVRVPTVSEEDDRNVLTGGASYKPPALPGYLLRQILSAVADFDKAMTVAKLRGARDWKRARMLPGS